LDEVFVKVNGRLCYLWRAVDHEREVFGQSTDLVLPPRERAIPVVDRLRRRFSVRRICVVAIGNGRQEVGGRLNGRVENSHAPFRGQGRAPQL
jgi:putative transposase